MTAGLGMARDGCIMKRCRPLLRGKFPFSGKAVSAHGQRPDEPVKCRHGQSPEVMNQEVDGRSQHGRLYSGLFMSEINSLQTVS